MHSLINVFAAFTYVSDIQISLWLLTVPGAPRKFIHFWNVFSVQQITLFVAASDFTSSKFCQLSESVWLLELRLLTKYTDLSNQNSADFAYADLKSNFKFRGYLRPIWPLVLLGCQNNLNFLIYWHFWPRACSQGPKSVSSFLPLLLLSSYPFSYINHH